MNSTQLEAETQETNQNADLTKSDAAEIIDTHYWKLSPNLGDQLLFLDLVANFLFLSLRCGPMM